MTNLVVSLCEGHVPHEKVELRCDETAPSISFRPFIIASKKLEILESLAALKPEYLDIPSHASLDQFLKIREKFPGQKILASFHDYEQTPQDLDSIYERLRALPCDAIKVATHAKSSLDGLRMLSFLKNRSAEFPLSAFCMGENGTFTRILQPLSGSFFSFCCLEGKKTGAGQLTYDEMCSIYRFKKLTQKTVPYALIGNPITCSLGHFLHNAIFEKMGHDAVYVKVQLDAHECHAALDLFTALGFHGLSITMPLKQVFFEKPYNTAVRKKDRWDFYNTDGSGALDFLGDVQGKKVLIYGAGGTAEAIGEEAKKRGAQVFITNRTLKHAEETAKKIGAESVQKPIQADIIVNATPVDCATSPTLDVRSTTDSGKEMWLRQGAKQQALWLSCHKALHLPASKSQTLRACLFASLASGTSRIENVLASPDVDCMVEACRALGALIQKNGSTLIIEGIGKKRALFKREIFAGNSGIVLRFLAALSAHFSEPITIIGDASTESRRSCSALVEGLTQLGAHIGSCNGHAPLTIKGPIQAGHITIQGQDSQPVSALLIATSLLEKPSHIHVQNGGERPWVDLTLKWLRDQSVRIEEPTPYSFVVHPVEEFQAFNYRVPGDLSQLAYLAAAALLTKGTTTIHDVDLSDPQGDKVISDILRRMGATFAIEGTQLTIHGPQQLHGIDVDVNDCIDMVTILAVLGCYAKGTTRIRGASVSRDKESNRLEVMTLELQKMKASIQETSDGLIIEESHLHGATLSSHHDHRVAMALAVASLFATGSTTISDIACVKKTYGNFFVDLERFT